MNSAEQPKIRDFFGFLKDAVKYHDGDEKWERLQTFAVIDQVQDINLDHLGKNITAKDKPFFYSHRWAQDGFPANALRFDYPAIFVRVLQPQFEKPFEKKRRECTDLEMYVAYPNVRECNEADVKQNCDILDVTEIHLAMRKLTASIFAYLETMTYASIDGAPFAWSNEYVLEALDMAGEISSYTEKKEAMRAYSTMLRQDNPSIQFQQFDNIGNHKLCGLVGQMKFCTPNCEDYVFNVNLDNCIKENYGGCCG